MGEHEHNIKINDQLLLELISSCAPLYDKTAPGYKSLLRKENCWQSISQSMKLPVSTLKARFKSLREKYRREITILKSLERSGAPASARPPWPLMSHFKFMMDHSEPRQTVSNFEQNTDHQIEALELSDSQVFLEDVDIDQISIEYDESVDEQLATVSPAMSPRSNGSEVASTSSDKRSVSSKRKQKTSRKEAVQEIDSVLRDVSNAVTSLVKVPEIKTKLNHFCDYLVAELRDFPLENAEIFMDKMRERVSYSSKFLRALHKSIDNCKFSVVCEKFLYKATMNPNEPGPSGSKKPRISYAGLPVRSYPRTLQRHWTEEELLQMLVESDDDLEDPSYIDMDVDDDEHVSSSESDGDIDARTSASENLFTAEDGGTDPQELDGRTYTKTPTTPPIASPIAADERQAKQSSSSSTMSPAWSSMDTIMSPECDSPLEELDQTMTADGEVEVNDNIQIKVSKDDYVIALTTISQYYSLPLIECIISQDVAIIGIHIPILKKELKDLVMKKVVTPTFAWNEYTCSVNIPSFTVALVQRNSKWTILVPKCDPFKEELCLVSEAHNTETIALLCVSQVLTGGTMKQFMSVCPINCRKTGKQNQFITPIGRHKFLRTVEPCGVSINTVAVIKKRVEQAEKENKAPEQPARKRIKTKSCDVEDFVKDAVKRKVYEMHSNLVVKGAALDCTVKSITICCDEEVGLGNEEMETL
ncbi:hypothetical protein RN001_003648 [Aquatica leii]|uniref:MADF domain-containing protein n=1 Tax=Aquatica leii TaxID=1421715 RepID=A0AAN7Q9R9_9COLE|nr:hypothetical protein RN001_003648 [Aquatica leii]